MTEKEIQANAPDERSDDLPLEPSRGLSRRGFLKAMAAAGVGVALASQGIQFVQARRQLATDLTAEQLIDMQRTMLRIRWFDRTVGERQLAGGYRGYMHGSPGHEGIAAGVNMALRTDDYVTGYHRSHHHTIGKGADLDRVAAEIEFKATGVNRGYGGSMHLMQKDVGMIGEDGIVGPGGIMAAGVAAGIKARGTDQVSVAYGGDAHFTTPYFALALHRAMQYQLPFIYVIEKNGYQTSKPVQGPGYLVNGLSGQSYLDSHTEIARGYRMPAVTVNGMSALEVYTEMKAAVDRARSGGGPTFIEAECYRYYDHFGVAGVRPGELGSFGRSYRSDREVRHWLAKDPIDLHRRTLIEWEVLTAAQADELEAEARAEVERAFRFADEAPVPDPRDGLKRVYTEGVVLPRQLADCPLYVPGYVEGTPTPAGFPEFAIGTLPRAEVRVEEIV